MARYIGRLKDIEYSMLVKLQADIAEEELTWPEPVPMKALDDDVGLRSITTVEELIGTLGTEYMASAGQLSVSLLAGFRAGDWAADTFAGPNGHWLARLGADTLGDVVAGTAVHEAIGELRNQAGNDPHQRMTVETCLLIHAMRQLILTGNAGQEDIETLWFYLAHSMDHPDDMVRAISGEAVDAMLENCNFGLQTQLTVIHLRWLHERQNLILRAVTGDDAQVPMFQPNPAGMLPAAELIPYARNCIRHYQERRASWLGDIQE